MSWHYELSKSCILKVSCGIKQSQGSWSYMVMHVKQGKENTTRVYSSSKPFPLLPLACPCLRWWTPNKSQRVSDSWFVSVLEGVANRPTSYRPGAPEPEPLCEMTVNMSYWKVNQPKSDNHRVKHNDYKERQRRKQRHTNHICVSFTLSVFLLCMGDGGLWNVCVHSFIICP